MIPTTPLRLATGVALAAIGLAACTTTPPTTTPGTSAAPTSASPSASATPTASVTPTPTLDADQAAALSQARNYRAAFGELAAKGGFDQYAIIKALRPTATDPVIQSNLNALRTMWKKGVHDAGSYIEVWDKVGIANAFSKGKSVEVTFCFDQRGLTVVDAKGRAQKDSYPDFLERAYDMRSTDGGRFKVHQSTATVVEGCDQ